MSYEYEAYLRDVTRPMAIGERVNVHVIPAIKIPEPDYEAMRRLVSGGDQKEDRSTPDEHAAT